MPSIEGPNQKGRDEEQEVSSMEMHNQGLHDQDEDSAGEKVDLATGKEFDNSTDTDERHLTIIKGGHNSEDVLGALPEENDAAAKWLREHGGDDLKKAA